MWELQLAAQALYVALAERSDFRRYVAVELAVSLLRYAAHGDRAVLLVGVGAH